MSLCNFGINPTLCKMTSKAFHESAHSYLSHSISHQISFKHIPQCQMEVLTFPGMCLSLWLLRFQCIFLSGQGALYLTYLSLGIQLGRQSITLGWGYCPLRHALTISYLKTHLSSNIVFICGPSTLTGNDINACSFILLMYLQWLAQDPTGNRPQYVAIE